MFIVEAYLQKRQAKINAWKEGRDKWIAEDKSGYGYRTGRDYARQHPYPVVEGETIAKIVATVISCIAVVSVVTFVIIGASNSTPKKTAPTVCSTVVKKGDKIGVNYGNFAGSKATVIRQNKNCSVDVTLTDSTNTFDKCKKSDSSNSCDGTLSNGAVLHLNKADNAIKL